jgi:hypothetical protein
MRFSRPGAPGAASALVLSALPAPPHRIVTPPLDNSARCGDDAVEKAGALLALSTDKTLPILAYAHPSDTNVVRLTLRMPSIVGLQVAFSELVSAAGTSASATRYS